MCIRDRFRFLFFKQCNDLSRILPRLFEDLDGSNSFSELLIVLSFNDPNGVVYRLVNEVDERWFDIHATDEDGKPMGQVQIMGWMYQYYNTEPKDKVFADLKKNIKISKQNIPAATQLFTPDWICLLYTSAQQSVTAQASARHGRSAAVPAARDASQAVLDVQPVSYTHLDVYKRQM